MTAKRFTLVAFLAAVLGALVAAFAPFGQEESSFGTAGSSLAGAMRTISYSHRVNMFQVNGAWVLVVVSVPVLVALIPVLVRRRTVRMGSALLLWIGCVLGLLSVGTFFIPAAIAMTMAATRGDPVVHPERTAESRP